MFQFYVRQAVILIAFLFLASCSTQQQKQNDTENDTVYVASPMVALDAYRQESEFIIRYRQRNRESFAGGNWQEKRDTLSDTSRHQYSSPSLIPLAPYNADSWNALQKNAIKLPVLSAEKWRLLRDRLLGRLMPEGEAGLVMSFEREDYFLYYDSMGEFQTVPLQEKPRNYRMKGNLDFEKLMGYTRPLLKKFLHEQGITQSEFLFSTGDIGLYSLPFLYVNTDRELLAFFRTVPEAHIPDGALSGLQRGQALVHVLRSHMSGLYLRPFSSLYRLLFLITDTTFSTVTFDWSVALRNQPVQAVKNSPPMDLVAWESELDDMLGKTSVNGSLDVMIDGKAFFTRLTEKIGAASKSIFLQTYIFDNDDYALQIGELLKQRSNEGVDVKVLLDGLGTITATMSDSPTLPEQHRPPVSVVGFLESDSSVQVRQKTNPWLTGDHVKTYIIDNDTAFVGGMNIGREYRYDWHDLMAELTGPVVNSINEQFDSAWAHAGPLGDLGYLFSFSPSDETKSTGEGYPLRILLTAPGNYEIYQAQLKAIRQAKSYIYIQNAYFTDDRILRELVKARRRGVDVRVIIPVETDHGPITRSNVLAANVMLENGIRVFIYPGFSHVKAAIYDGWVCMGSANFDRLSLRINRELNIASSHPEVSRQLLEQLFEPDFEVSPELTEPLPERWVDRLVEVVGDYLY